MFANINIALRVPDSDRPDRYFSLRLKRHLCDEPSEYETPSKIFVISDIEGNFLSFCNLLLQYQVIDKYFNWQFEQGHLVILGDCFDRGEHVAECLWLIYSLEEKAKKEKGYVHFLLGNHEIMNLNGDWRYVHPKYALSTASLQRPPTALYDGNNELWRWLLTKNIIEKIGNILFVHGGISKELLALDYSIAEINCLARPYYTHAGNFLSSELLQIVFNSDKSPFWYRGYYNESVTMAHIDATLDRYNVKTIITGHTLVQHITTHFSGKIINTDTNHSNGRSEALFIKRNKFYRVDGSGNKIRIK